MKTILVDAVDCFVSNKGEINQAMYKMLERYENPKIIVTNAPDDKLSVFGLDKVPYPVFSLQKNPSKTDPTYWQIFLEKNNLSIEDVVYFEHAEEAVKSALSVGITTFYYETEKTKLEEVAHFLDKNISQK